MFANSKYGLNITEENAEAINVTQATKEDFFSKVSCVSLSRQADGHPSPCLNLTLCP